jgi:hypothetical protein
MRRILPSALTIGMLACGGSSSAPQQSPYGGTYSTHVSLLPGDNCTSHPTVQDGSTIVAQNGTSPSVSLTHAGNTYATTVNPSGDFTVPATMVSGATVDMTGHFAGDGFTATVNVQQASPACTYSVSWQGTKTSNTYPGDPYTGTH